METHYNIMYAVINMMMARKYMTFKDHRFFDMTILEFVRPPKLSARVGESS
jgi:hypothetical protein